MDDERRDAVARGVHELRREPRPLVLAVSGGVDSMVLHECAARALPGRIAAVATFDHRSGEHSRDAARLVVRRARALGLHAVAGRARDVARTEAEWRRARWSFLRHVARDVGGVVVTAHTADDQVETVLLRALREAGARGLAGLLARTGVRRPLLGVTRAEVEAWAHAHGVSWIDDPGNASLAHRRNRVRHELLPAMRRARPSFDAELLAIGERAADWRADVEALARRLASADGEVIHVAADSLAGYDRSSLGVLWPAMAGLIGVALDRRGTARLVGFTIHGDVGGRIQLAGGWEVVRRRGDFVLRRAIAPSAVECDLPPSGALRWGRWSFYRRPAPAGRGDDPWRAGMPSAGRLTVRAWVPGDRMRGTDGRPRRVKRFLRDAGIAGVDRAGWPVVVADGEIVWIPGVRRSDAATERSGRPGFSIYCELDDRRHAGR
jgi:tRNA(Ile)-lysidine synthase